MSFFGSALLCHLHSLSVQSLLDEDYCVFRNNFLPLEILLWYGIKDLLHFRADDLNAKPVFESDGKSRLLLTANFSSGATEEMEVQSQVFVGPSAPLLHPLPLLFFSVFQLVLWAASARVLCLQGRWHCSPPMWTRGDEFSRALSGQGHCRQSSLKVMEPRVPLFPACFKAVSLLKEVR